jgi:hypothetical protein
MAVVMKYTVSQFNEISESQFNYELTEDAFNKINYLCSAMNVAPLTSRTFVKKVKQTTIQTSVASSSDRSNDKRKKGNKRMEVNDEEWDKIWSFQTTKMEKKVGIDSDIDQIRSILNKITEKTYLENREKLFAKLNTIVESYSVEDISKLSNTMYDLLSTNSMNAEMFSLIFAELVSTYSWFNALFREKFSTTMDIYSDIHYVDADKDYDGFCEMNKKNAKRRATTNFCLYLFKSNVLTIEEIGCIANRLILTVMDLIDVPNKKNEVDELTENIVMLLYQKDQKKLIEVHKSVIAQCNVDAIAELSEKTAKDCVSLSSKSIFKYMDIQEFISEM